MAFPTHIADIQPFVELHVSSWASVYKAYQPSLDRVVLLKVLNPQFSKQEENAAWFKSEAKLTAKVEHPNVVSIYGYGECEDGLYFTVEFVEGTTLREVIDRGGIPYPIALFIVEQMLLGLQAAHKQGVLHRDLKPENVLISLEGHVKLCDFGFASMMDAVEEGGEIRGTIGYMAPETIMEGTSNERSDIFAVGAILYEMLLGTKAYVAQEASSYIQLLQSHNPIPYLETCTFILEPIRSVCKRMLTKAPEDRVGSAAEAIASIRTVVQTEKWNISSHSLSEWWTDPGSYQIPEVPVKKILDREPVSKEDSNKTDARQRENTPKENNSKENKGAWLWWPSLAILLVIAVIALVNGVGERPPNTPITQEIEEAAALNAVSMSATALDSTFVDNVEAEKRGGKRAAEEPIPEVETSQQIKLNEPSQVDSLSGDASLPRDSTASEIDSLTHMEPAEGLVTVFCLPSCTVQVAEEEMGTAPPALTMRLLAGEHQIRLNNPDFPPYMMRLEVAHESHDTLTVSLLETIGTLELKVIPWGEVFIDGTSYDVFPPSRPIRVWPGEHTLRVVHKELGEQELTFTIGKNEKLERTINFSESRVRRQ